MREGREPRRRGERGEARRRNNNNLFSARLRVLRVSAVLLVIGACRQDMHDQPRFEPLEKSAFFDDGRSARPRVPGTVARGERDPDEHLLTGKQDGALATSFPFPVTREVLERGQQRFEIYCAPCHDRAGTGQGVVVQRGLKQPPSFHVERLRNAPAGHFFDVITRGFGAMSDLSDRIETHDRWAIVAYVRALQQSQNATLEDVPPAERERLKGASR